MYRSQLVPGHASKPQKRSERQSRGRRRTPTPQLTEHSLQGLSGDVGFSQHAGSSHDRRPIAEPGQFSLSQSRIFSQLRCRSSSPPTTPFTRCPRPRGFHIATHLPSPQVTGHKLHSPHGPHSGANWQQLWRLQGSSATGLPQPPSLYGSQSYSSTHLPTVALLVAAGLRLSTRPPSLPHTSTAASRRAFAPQLPEAPLRRSPEGMATGEHPREEGSHYWQHSPRKQASTSPPLPGQSSPGQSDRKGQRRERSRTPPPPQPLCKRTHADT